MACHVLRQHVGDQGFVPASHLIDTFLLVVDLNLPQEQCPCQLFHLWTDTGNMCALSWPFRVAQWLGPGAFTAVSLGSVPGWGTKIP